MGAVVDTMRFTGAVLVNGAVGFDLDSNLLLASDPWCEGCLTFQGNLSGSPDQRFTTMTLSSVMVDGSILDNLDIYPGECPASPLGLHQADWVVPNRLQGYPVQYAHWQRQRSRQHQR